LLNETLRRKHKRPGLNQDSYYGVYDMKCVLGYLKKYYFENPSDFKLIKLLNSQNVTEINNLGKCI